MEKLTTVLTCPFCGSKAKPFKNAVSCVDGCFAIGPNLSDGEGGDHTEEAILAWNKRINPDKKVIDILLNGLLYISGHNDSIENARSYSAQVAIKIINQARIAAKGGN